MAEDIELLRARAKAKLRLRNQTESAEPEIVDEMHPDIGLWDRFLYKNLGTSAKEGIKFFQKEYPELEFKTDPDDKILAKRKDETEWRRLDPSEAEFSDITDALYDVVAGVGETAASAAGGVAGAVGGTAIAPGVGTALGAGLGASAAGAAAGTGIEGLRQGLGQLAGVSEEVDPEQLKQSALFGAASPLLFGTGAAGKQVVKGASKMLSTGVGKAASAKAGEEFLQTIAKGQSGLIGRTYRGAKNIVAPRAGQMMSGIEADTLRWAAKDLASPGSTIRAAEDAYGQVAIYGELRDQIENAHQANKQVVGDMYGEALNNLNVNIDVVEAEQPLQKLLKKYEDNALKTIEKFGDAAENRVEVQNYEYLKGVLDEYAHGVGTLQGGEAQQYLDLLNDLTKIRKNVNIQGMEKVDKELINAAKQTAKNVDQAMLKFDSGGVLKEAKNEYAKVISREDQIKKYFKDEEATERTVNSLMSPRKNARRKEVMNLAHDVGVDVSETARESIAASLFSRPSMDIQSLGGTTSTSRSVPLGGLGGMLGYLAASRMSTGGHGPGVAGAGIGMWLGSKLGSPAAMRNAMEMNARLNRMGGTLQNIGPGVLPAIPQTGINIWQQMEQNRR